jgi:hypothetical protein
LNIYITQSSRITSPRLFKLLQVLYGLNALLWLASFLTNQTHLRQAGLEYSQGALIITGLMGGNAIALLLAGLCLTRKCRLYLYFTASLVLFNIMLVVIDPLHLFNPLIVLVNLLILVLLPMIHTSPPTSYE